MYVQNPGAYSWIYRANCFTVGTSAPAPVLITPANGTVYTHKFGLWVTLAWKPVKGATGYTLDADYFRESTQKWVPATIIIDGEANPSFTISTKNPDSLIDDAPLWRWRVAAAGVAGPQWSEYRYFTFSRARLPTPTLVTPEDNIVLYHKSGILTFIWSPVPGAYWYNILIQRFDGGEWHEYASVKKPLDVNSMAGCAYFAGGLMPGTTYRWCVFAQPEFPISSSLSAYDDSNPSEWRTFTFSTY